MSSLTTQVKVSNSVESILFSQMSTWQKLLKQGNLYEFENQISRCMVDLQNEISESLVKEAAEDLCLPLTERGRRAGGRKIEMRSCTIRLASGHRIEAASPYVKQPKAGWAGSRHLLVRHWGLIGEASPGLYDKVGYCAALGPSYELAHQTLSKFDIQVCQSSVRDLTNRLGEHCARIGEEHLVLKPDEKLAGKRVVISLDGGRTRMREYIEAEEDSRPKKYETPWREPKLFVIDVLDESGRPARYELPIYGVRFAPEALFDLLRSYLSILQIDQAEQIQIIADGAPWIWNYVKPLLEELGVESSRIIETLDYYHASNYVHQLVEQMPKRINKRQRKCYLEQFKEWLWQGQARNIVRQCREIFQRGSQEVKRWINYLDKHRGKMQYTDFERNKLMCGSGIVESAIRRIINLRFKNAATFWNQDTVEKLFCLRAALLSKRWDTLMTNLANVN
jgi:hypothetical protein